MAVDTAADRTVAAGILPALHTDREEAAVDPTVVEEVAGRMAVAVAAGTPQGLHIDLGEEAVGRKVVAAAAAAVDNPQGRHTVPEADLGLDRRNSAGKPCLANTITVTARGRPSAHRARCLD